MIAAASDDEGDKGVPAIDPEVLPPLAATLEQIVIDPGEPLLPAGAVSAMVEGMIVVQARMSSRIHAQRWQVSWPHTSLPFAATLEQSVPIPDHSGVQEGTCVASHAGARTASRCAPGGHLFLKSRPCVL